MAVEDLITQLSAAPLCRKLDLYTQNLVMEV